MKEKVLNLETLAALVNERGVKALVEQTGGGCATLITYDSSGESLVAAGPGWFEGPCWSEGRATWDEFCWGPDNDTGDDCTYERAVRDLAAVADDIVALSNRLQSAHA